MDLDRRIDVLVEKKSYSAGDGRLCLEGTIRITTPEREPALIELDYRVRLKSPPPMPDDELPGLILALIADRLAPPLPKADGPDAP